MWRISILGGAFEQGRATNIYMYIMRFLEYFMIKKNFLAVYKNNTKRRGGSGGGGTLFSLALLIHLTH